jgi:transcriptional regulator with XRE-family HTH domain
MNIKKVGRRIKRLRGEQGLKQEEVAGKLGIRGSTLLKIENGDIVPTAKILLELRRHFSTSIDYILTGEGYIDAVINVDCDSEILEMIRHMPQDKVLKYTVLSCYYKSKSHHSELKR